MTQAEQRNSLTEQQVSEWLEENPAVLLRLAQKMAEKEPEAENITPLHAMRAAKAEKKGETLALRQERLMKVLHANATSSAILFAVIPDVVRCADLAALRKYLQISFRQAMDLDSVRLILVGEKNTATTMTEKEINAFFEDSFVNLRTLYDAEDRAIYGTAGKMFKSDALFRLQSQKGDILGMLALASEEESRFHPGQGQDLALFFGEVFSAVLEKVRKD